MEENSEKNMQNEEDFTDFKDFDSGESEMPDIEQEEITSTEHEDELLKEAELIAKLTQEQNFGTPEYLNSNQDFENQVEEQPFDNEQPQKNEENPTEPAPVELPPEPAQWEELDDDNSVVKKYIFYVSKDFIPIIDSLTTDERTAYINDAIQKKVDSEYETNIINRKKRILIHLLLTILTFLIVTPIALFIIHKSIMVTFENYKYSQESFEKLYKKHFENDRAYMWTVKYNESHKKDSK